MLSLIKIELKAFIAEQRRTFSRFVISVSVLALCLSITLILSAVLETLAERRAFKLPSGANVYTLALLSDDKRQIQLSAKAIKYIRTLNFESLATIVAVNNVELPVSIQAQQLNVKAQILHFDVFSQVIDNVGALTQPNQVILSQHFRAQLTERLGVPVQEGSNIQIRGTLFRVLAIAPPQFKGIGVSSPDLWLPYQQLTFAYGLPASVNNDGLFEVPGTQIYAISSAQQSEVAAEIFWLEQVLSSESLLPTGTTLAAIRGVQPNFNQFKNISQLSWLNWSGSIVLLLLGMVSFFRFRLIQLNNGLNAFVTKVALGLNHQMVFLTLLAQTFVSLLIVFAVALVLAGVSQHTFLAQLGLGIDHIALSGLIKYIAWSIPAAVVLAWIQLKALTPALSNNIASKNSASGSLGAMLINGLISATFIALLLFLLMIVQKFQAYVKTPYGYSADDIVVLPLKKRAQADHLSPTDLEVFIAQLSDKAKQSGLNIAFAANAPMDGKETGMMNYFIPSALNDGQDKVNILVNHVSTNYFKLLELELKQGRLMESGYEVVVNERLVKQYFNGHITLPTTIYIAAFKPGTTEPMRIARNIVGVIRDNYPNSKNDTIQPMIFASIEDIITIRNLVISGKIKELSSLGRQLMPSQSLFQPQPPYVLAQKVKADTLEEATRLSLFAIVALLSMCIFFLGVYTQLAQQMDGQRRQLAIRFALGATNNDIFRLAIISALKTFLPGAAMALIGFTILCITRPQWLGTLEPQLTMVLFAGGVFALFITISTFLVYRSHRETDVSHNLFDTQ